MSKIGNCRQNVNTIPELKTAIQSETEVISTETLSKVLNSFVLRLHEVRDLRGHHVINILV
jgi:hypothetical protein